MPLSSFLPKKASGPGEPQPAGSANPSTVSLRRRSLRAVLCVAFVDEHAGRHVADAEDLFGRFLHHRVPPFREKGTEIRVPGTVPAPDDDTGNPSAQARKAGIYRHPKTAAPIRRLLAFSARVSAVSLPAQPARRFRAFCARFDPFSDQAGRNGGIFRLSFPGVWR